MRCGSCAIDFDALLTLTDELPVGELASLKRHVPSTIPPALVLPAARPVSKQQELFVANRTEKMDQTIAEPQFVRRHARDNQLPRHRAWNAVNALLVIVALLQLSWFYREAMMRDSMTRSVFEKICLHTFFCATQQIDDRRRIALMARDIRPHPTRAHALIISATLTNQGLLAQSYPIVEIVLSDANARRIAMRRFYPKEYTQEGAVLRAGLPAGSSAHFSFEVEDPSRDAVAFEFRFL
jgi:hypothetical protein